MKKILLALIAITALVGCDDAKTKLHMQPNQNEQECLDSEKLKFKDPEVLFVANLGSRGLPAVPDQYWVRYKAKNSYGAYLQGNMICRLDVGSGKWVRDGNAEYLLEIKITAELMEAVNIKLKDPIFREKYFSKGFEATRDLQAKEARELLFTSPEDLGKSESAPK